VVPTRRDKVEQKIAGIERLGREILSQAQDLRVELGKGESADDMWARMIREVLAEIDKRGGSVPREEVLEIGEAAGYDRHGMAGFYQKMLKLENGVATLTDYGRAKLKRLNALVAA
jgi:hypothetical protein